MDTNAAITLLHKFLARSPRTALEVQVLLNDQHWLWRYGKAEQMPSPVFEIGSVGKVFTTTLLALLVQRKQLNLTDSIKRFYPQIPCAKHITLQQLATHTSGLPRDPFSWRHFMRHSRQVLEEFQPDDLIAFVQQQPSVLKSAGKAHYSNVGMALLGRILGDVSGQSYGTAVHEFILQPLGMHDTHLEPEHFDPQRLIQGHNSRGRPVPPFAWRGMEPAGLWRSTGADMMTFLRAQRGLLHEPNRPDGDLWANLAIETTRPQAQMMKDVQVGLGWMLSTQDPWGQVASHDGCTIGQHSMVAWSLNQSTAIVLLTDRAPPWWHHLMANRQLEMLAERLLEALSQEPSNG